MGDNMGTWMSAVLAAACLAGTGGIAIADTTTSCHELAIPVADSPGAKPTRTMYGELCTPAESSPSTVHILVTPSVTNHTYWDPNLQPERYSYVRALNSGGDATLNVDAI